MFAPLTIQQLEWKPALEKWSISECLHHLNMTADLYFPVIRTKLAETDKESVKENQEYRSTFTGKLAVYAMKPKSGSQINFKMKTFKAINPNLIQEAPEDSRTAFLILLNVFENFIHNSQHLNLNQIKITSPLSRVVRLNLGDAFLFLIAHMQRHILQAKNVMNNQNFPAK